LNGVLRRWDLRYGAAVAAVLGVALALRVWGLRSGLPWVYNVDEAQHFVPHAVAMLGGNLNPQYFGNPAAFTYVLAGLLVLGFIAKTVTHNGRDLDGALNRLLAHNKLTGQVVTVEMAERAVRDLVRPQDPKRVKIEDIQRVVARQYNVSRADLLSSRRTANVVRPRQIAMYLAKALTLRSLPEIGRRFGGRDHTTVLHAVRKIETLASNDSTLAEEIELLKRLLQEP